MNKLNKILINVYNQAIHNHERVKAINRVQFGPIGY